MYKKDNKSAVLTHCQICDSPRIGTIFRFLNKNYFNTYLNIAVCNACGHIFLNPRWTAEQYADYYHRMYDEVYRPNANQNITTEMQAVYESRILSIIQRLNSVDPDFNPPRLLDVGAGPGWSLQLFQRMNRNVDIFAIESSQECINNLRRLNIKVLGGSIESVPAEEPFFDFINMRHVLEHLPFPLESLQKVHSLLQPNGLVYIAVPNMEKPLHPMLKKWFRHAHVSYFNKFSLEVIAAKAGLSKLVIKESDNEIYGIFKKGLPSNQTGVIKYKVLSKKIRLIISLYQEYLQGVLHLENFKYKIKKSIKNRNAFSVGINRHTDSHDIVGKNKALLFIPHYSGSLKYLFKLHPHLSEEFKIQFLFLPKTSSDKRFQTNEMIEFCDINHLSYINLDSDDFYPKLSIPFLTAYQTSKLFLRKVSEVFKSLNTVKIISTGDGSWYHDLLFSLAKRKNIKTALIQWALTYGGVKKHNQNNRPIIIKFYSRLTSFLLHKLFGVGYHTANVLGGGLTDQMGVINAPAYEFFINQKIPQDKLSIIGYMDFYDAEETFIRIKNNTVLEQRLMQEYDFKPDKKVIAIFTQPFNAKDICIFSDQEQSEYYEKIVKQIRSVFSESEADVIIKIHPAEKIAIYLPLVKYGVRIYDKSTNACELIYLTDLYICHHSTTNYIPITMQKQAIFINFAKLPFMNDTKRYFGIKQYIEDHDEFKELLSKFKTGHLPAQYHNDVDIIIDNSKDKIINWVIL